jgi:hypothetical protein
MGVKGIRREYRSEEAVGSAVKRRGDMVWKILRESEYYIILV